MEVNVIREIFKGHYQVILDFPDVADIGKILSLEYQYIWGFSHTEHRTNWVDYNHSLFERELSDCKVKARNMHMEYLIETPEFLKLVPFINQSLRIIQTNHIPPYYLNITNIKGKAKYDMLKDSLDYLFELELPGAADYAPIVSPSLDFLEDLLMKFR